MTTDFPEHPDAVQERQLDGEMLAKERADRLGHTTLVPAAELVEMAQARLRAMAAEFDGVNQELCAEMHESANDLDDEMEFDEFDPEGEDRKFTLIFLSALMGVGLAHESS